MSSSSKLQAFAISVKEASFPMGKLLAILYFSIAWMLIKELYCRTISNLKEKVLRVRVPNIVACEELHWP